ncbi:hypothetical protein J6590_027515 [Homalodisca vitripennis]|nr:hypothetical protein J6590_027515 [Homalodisca vitripennis]
MAAVKFGTVIYVATSVLGLASGEVSSSTLYHMEPYTKLHPGEGLQPVANAATKVGRVERTLNRYRCIEAVFFFTFSKIKINNSGREGTCRCGRRDSRRVITLVLSEERSASARVPAIQPAVDQLFMSMWQA